MVKFLAFLLLSLFCESTFAQRSLHESYDALLRKYVSTQGVVDYKNFKKNEKALDDYLKHLSSNPPGKNADRNEKLAYWINAYNAFTIKLILNNYPVKSIQDIDRGKPWDKVWIKIGNNNYSLNNIEHDIIRKQFKDARIHFALNCSAKSCPPLLNRAYNARSLNEQLEEQTKLFINDSKFNNIHDSSVKLSMIFNWYAEDFADVKKFIAKYRKINPASKISWLEYDWSLNGK